MALLTLAAAFCNQHGVTCRAVTVDHGLRPEAAQEARIVAGACAAMGIAHSTLTWRRTTTGAVSQEDARRARHRLMAKWAETHGVDRIALGHTRDDRLETFLMRARQGSGWYGLAGLMPNGFSPVWPEGRSLPIVRPLLAFGREELRDELRTRGIGWIDDPSNDSARFERVRMRRLLARLDGRARDKALRVMDQLMRVRSSVMEEATALLRQVRPMSENAVDIPLAARTLVGAEAWRRFIEAHLMAVGGSERPPRRDALDRLLARIGSGDAGLTRGVTLGGARIQTLGGAVLRLSPAPPRRGASAPEIDRERVKTLLHAPDLRALSV